MVASAITEEIDALWSELGKRVQAPLYGDHEVTELLDDVQSECSALGRDSFEPWLAIFQQGIQWLAHLHASLDSAFRSGAVPKDDRTPIAFIGAASAYAVSVRHLTLSGLDSPARALARVLAESLNLATAVAQDPRLRDSIRAPESPEDVNRYWYENLRPKHMARVLDQAERSLGIDDETRADLRAERESQARWLSQFTHPSWVVSELTCMPISTVDPALHKLGTLGQSTPFSIHTLDTGMKAIWLFARVGYVIVRRTFGDWEPDRDNDIDVGTVVGHRVFCELVERHWEDADEVQVSQSGRAV